MHHRRKHASRGTWVAGLILVALVAMFLPRSWTVGLMSLVQVVVPFQDAATQAIETVVPDGRHNREQVSAEVYAATERRLQALQNMVEALSTHVDRLKSENDQLRGIRGWAVAGESFGPEGRLIPGRILAGDALPWRESAMVNAGTLQGVRLGAPVFSQHFSIDVGTDEGVEDGMAILLQETLIGFIADAGTHTSRVRLFSDPDNGMTVRIMRIDEAQGTTTFGGEYWLTGRGHGKMSIAASCSDIDDGLIDVDDLVLLPADDAGLPVSMCIGRVSQIERDKQNRSLCDLQVLPTIDLTRVRKVFVYEPEETPDR